jgi:hypothetical protein
MNSKASSVKRKDTRYVQGGKAETTKKYVGWWERSNTLISSAPDDIVIDSLPLIYEGRPDLLSYDLYDNNNLEWIILQYNSIVDINEEFVEGARLVVPSVARVFGSILVKTLDYGNTDV